MQEIQGLRGIAIIGVLLFHLWPKIFPNSYVGVDMFFVISGYLMAMIFSKYNTVDIRNSTDLFVRFPMISIKTLVDFYYKRVKRILPLYYLAVPLTLLAGHIWLTVGWIETHNVFAYYSITLLKNMKTIWDGSNYFLSFQSTGHQKDLFLHLWSLAVEIQFYLFVPFILFGCQLLRTKILKLAFLLILSAGTCYLYYYSNPIFSFNFAISRLWQFGLGMIAFTSKEVDSNLGEKKRLKSPNLNFLEECLIFTGFIPLIAMLTYQKIPPEYMRPLGTLSCFVFLFVGNEVSKKILTNKFLTYTGDISYSLYLIHWPVIVLFNQHYSIQYVLGIILSLSIFSYHCYENTYRKLSTPKIIALLIGLTVLNVVTYRTFTKCPYVMGKLEEFRYNQIDKSHLTAVLENVKFSKERRAMQPAGVYNSSSTNIHPAFTWPWGIWDFPKGHGTRKIMIIGNSYVINEAGMIHETFEGNYSEFRRVAGLGFQVLVDTWSPGTTLAGQHELAFQLVEQFKPDMNDEQLTPLTTDPKDDLFVQAYNQNLARLEKSCGKILLHGPSLPVPMVHLNSFIDALSNGVDLDGFRLNKEAVDKELLPGRTRFNSITCSKCQVYDILKVFVERRMYLTFDPETNKSFFDDDVHFTMAGLDRLRPVYRELIAQL